MTSTWAAASARRWPADAVGACPASSFWHSPILKLVTSGAELPVDGAHELPLDRAQQSKAVGVAESRDGLPLDSGSEYVAGEVDLGAYQGACPIATGHRGSGRHGRSKPSVLAQQVMDGVESHSDRQLLGAASWSTPLAQALAEKLSFISGQVEIDQVVGTGRHAVEHAPRFFDQRHQAGTIVRTVCGSSGSLRAPIRPPATGSVVGSTATSALRQ